MLKKVFFSKFRFSLQPAEHSQVEENIEFILPYDELRHIISDLSNQASSLVLRYPVGDSKLQVSMNQVCKGIEDFEFNTEIFLDVHDVGHDMDFEYTQFKAQGIAF